MFTMTRKHRFRDATDAANHLTEAAQKTWPKAKLAHDQHTNTVQIRYRDKLTRHAIAITCTDTMLEFQSKHGVPFMWPIMETLEPYLDDFGITAAAARCGITISHTGKMHILGELQPGEVVAAVIADEKSSPSTYAAVTTSRVVVVQAKGIMRKLCEPCDAENVTRINARGFTNAGFSCDIGVTPERTFILWDVQPSSLAVFHETWQEVVQRKHLDAESARLDDKPGAPPEDVVGRLGAIADMHARGVLSDAEFAALKQRIIRA